LPKPTTSWSEGGSYAGKGLDKAGVQALASIPSREELLAKLLGVMQAPVPVLPARSPPGQASAKKLPLRRLKQAR
jgi:hypothetical protein